MSVELTERVTGCREERHYERARIEYPGGEFEPLPLDLRTCPPE